MPPATRTLSRHIPHGSACKGEIRRTAVRKRQLRQQSPIRAGNATPLTAECEARQAATRVPTTANRHRAAQRGKGGQHTAARGGIAIRDAEEGVEG